MGLILKESNGDFERPPVGMHKAVCTNYIDLGIQDGKFGPKHKIVILWEIEERKTKGEFAGKRFVIPQEYGASLNEKATLRKDLESWRGRPFTAEELAGFDLDKVKGKNCLLNLVEKEDNGKTWINVASVNPPMKGAEALTAETPDYVPEWVLKKINHADGNDQPMPKDDAIPF